MELRSLKYFQSVYELGSISAAARACFVSQPSITTAIKQLESDLDVIFFVRHARGVLPTNAADKLYPKAKEIADNAKSINHLFSGAPTPVILRLGIMRSLGAQRMCSLLKSITEKIANVELTLVDPEEPCDARVVVAHSVPSNERFIPIWQDNYQLGVPKSWAVAQQSSVNITELEGMPFINRSPCDALDKLKVLMADESVRFQARANIKTIEYAWQLVGAGIGAALLPDWPEILEAEELSIIPIANNTLVKEIGLAFKHNKENSPIITELKAICCACAKLDS